MFENENVLSKNKCKFCNNKLGTYFDKKKTKIYKREYFSINPYVIDDVRYYREVCVDCFYKEHGRFPMSPNVVNYDFSVLLGIEKTILAKNIKNKKAITLENLIKKYGIKEGKKRFVIYKEKQAYSNSFQYKNEKYGWTPDKYNLYNKSRAVTMENCIKKHGETDGKIIFEDYCKKQKYVGSSLEYFINKYGEIGGNKKWIDVCKSKAIRIENFILKYGEIEGTEKFLSIISKGFSKSSQTFFWELYNLLPMALQKNVYFAELNREYGIYSNLNSRAYLYDFVIKNYGVCIEYNGEHVHPNKDVLSINEWKKWKCTWSNVSADVKYAYDIEKHNEIIKTGYDVYVVWDKNVKNNRMFEIKESLKWINNKVCI